MNYYEILGISRYATQEQIKKAFRDATKKYHPDVNKDHDSVEKMRIVLEAYQTLSDLNARKEYDKKTASHTPNGNAVVAYNSYNKEKVESEKDLDEWVKNILSKMKPISTTNDSKVEKIETTNLHVCLYDDECAGIFKKITLRETMYDLLEFYHDVYIGIHSLKCGIRSHDSNGRFSSFGKSIKTNKGIFSADCNMYYSTTYDDMRLRLYEQGQIGTFKLGETTNDEMLKVLIETKKYAAEKNNSGKKLAMKK